MMSADFGTMPCVCGHRMAVLAAAVVVSYVYDTGTANESCPNGTPHFGWQLPV